MTIIAREDALLAYQRERDRLPSAPVRDADGEPIPGCSHGGGNPIVGTAEPRYALGSPSFDRDGRVEEGCFIVHGEWEK